MTRECGHILLGLDVDCAGHRHDADQLGAVLGKRLDMLVCLITKLFGWNKYER
jgi:hypothetical protein